jgi:mono/diheme cytochrome c family protein
VTLIAAGLVIAALFFGLTVPSGSPLHPGGALPPSFTPAALGERIYTAGRDENGNVIRRSTYGMFGAATCADCHGSDAKGRTISYMMGSFETHDIRWSTLSQPHQEKDGTMVPAYDAVRFGLAMTQGIEPSGETLEPPMPRWDLTPAQVEALIAFLKTK